MQLPRIWMVALILSVFTSCNLKNSSSHSQRSPAGSSSNVSDKNADGLIHAQMGLTACACDAIDDMGGGFEDMDGQDVNLDHSSEPLEMNDVSEADLQQANPGPEDELQLGLDETVYVGNNRVQIPTLKGDRCHAGGAAVHPTVIDSKGQVYKMIPKDVGGVVTWVTVDGRPGPSNSVWKQVINNPVVKKAMSKLITRLLPGLAVCVVTLGYDNYVSAGETGGYRILDKIKSMRSVQEICSPDANGVIQPVLDRSGVVPGGAPSGGDLRYEIIYDWQYGWIFTSYYLVDDCSWLERRFGCNLTKKVWVIGPDQHQQVQEQCIKGQ